MEKLCTYNPTIIVVGARGSGKSVAMKDIMYRFHLAGVPRCVVFSMTEGANGFFSSFVPSICIYCPVTIESITSVWEQQKVLALKKRLKQIPEDVNIRLIMILDDIAFDKKLLKCKCLQEIFLNGRHYDCILILSLQYIMSLDVAMRSNADLGVFLADSNGKNRERIFANFANCFDELKTFNAVFGTCTENHEAFLIYRKGKSNSVSDSCFYYKADNKLAFEFGSPDVWRFNRRRYLSEEDKFLQQQQRVADLLALQPDTDVSSLTKKKTSTNKQGELTTITKI